MKSSIFVLIVMFLLSGCSDFLDVTPKDKQTSEQLYRTKNGFYTVANGIYDGLSSVELYGQQMSWEAIDIMSKRYVTTKASLKFKDLCSNNYSSTYVSPVFTSIWKKAYELIMAANLLIEQVEQQHGILTEQEANLMKGEMLAVRAFLHLDMARLFGPCWDNNPDALSIPYHESTEVTTLPLLSFSTVMEKIIRDFNDAEVLLADDPVITSGPLASSVEGESVQLRYRQFRFNYYSVIALKARAYLWGGNKESALVEAKRLLNDPKVHEYFPVVDPNKLLVNTTNPDRVFSSEVLTGVYVKKRDEIFSNYFASTAPVSNFLQPHSTYVSGSQTSLFAHLLLGAETMDYRFQSQWEGASGVGAKGHVFTKYRTIDKPDPDDEDSEYFYSKMIPLVKLAELYYIATECEPELVDGLKWYNEIRGHRGCLAFPEAYASMIPSYFGGWGMLLSQEYMREFYGEGQAFFFLKRITIMAGYPRGTVTPYDNGESQSMSTLDVRPPLPEGEMK
ncbi:RagB/SusD family nutrient uptake outer membrane protein [Butyricimonas virosa]|nr:RagB/SusD family nutrient uptake outer membrane protein [Butyricimonas virosa]